MLLKERKQKLRRVKNKGEKYGIIWRHPFGLVRAMLGPAFCLSSFGLIGSCVRDACATERQKKVASDKIECVATIRQCGV